MFQSDWLGAGMRVRRDGSLLVYAVRRLLTELRAWRVRAEWRRELAKLDDHQLRDVGLDPETVRRETEKPFWRA